MPSAVSFAVVGASDAGSSMDGRQMEAHRGAVLIRLWGAILVLAGCAAPPQVVMRDLPLAGMTRVSGSSIDEVSLHEAGVSNRGDRVFLTRISLRNHMEVSLPVGPQAVYLADQDGILLPRISERWLPNFYEARMRGIPVAPDREAVVAFPLTEAKLGDAVYTAPPLTPGQQGELAAEVAKLVEAAFVDPQREGRGTALHKGPEVVLGALLNETVVGPGERVIGYVYFYRPITRIAPYPLRLVIQLQDAVQVFRFRQP